MRAAKAATVEQGAQALAVLDACLEEGQAPHMPSLLLTKADLLLLLHRCLGLCPFSAASTCWDTIPDQLCQNVYRSHIMQERRCRCSQQ